MRIITTPKPVHSATRFPALLPFEVAIVLPVPIHLFHVYLICGLRAGEFPASLLENEFLLYLAVLAHFYNNARYSIIIIDVTVLHAASQRKNSQRPSTVVPLIVCNNRHAELQIPHLVVNLGFLTTPQGAVLIQANCFSYTRWLPLNL